jgi:hypothetical protein
MGSWRETKFRSNVRLYFLALVFTYLPWHVPFQTLQQTIMTNINYHTIHRSGCSLKRDSFIDPNRLYITHNAYETRSILLFCDFKGVQELIVASFEVLIVNGEIDYSAYHSLN